MVPGKVEMLEFWNKEMERTETQPAIIDCDGDGMPLPISIGMLAEMVGGFVSGPGIIIGRRNGKLTLWKTGVVRVAAQLGNIGQEA